MKLQFSLATLLVCLTVPAVVCALAVEIDVAETRINFTAGSIMRPTDSWEHQRIAIIHRPPTALEMIERIFMWGIPALITTLAVLWSIRRLKSRRHTEPPVG
jgi:hypothetical protein